MPVLCSVKLLIKMFSHLETCVGKKSSHNLPKVVGRVNLLVFVGLRTPASYWLWARATLVNTLPTLLVTEINTESPRWHCSLEWSAISWWQVNYTGQQPSKKKKKKRCSSFALPAIDIYSGYELTFPVTLLSKLQSMWTSFVVQWLRICLIMQGCRFNPWLGN